VIRFVGRGSIIVCEEDSDLLESCHRSNLVGFEERREAGDESACMEGRQVRYWSVLARYR